MQGTTRTRPSGSRRPLREAYDTALLDLDGVVYVAGDAVPHAVAVAGAPRAGRACGSPM